jgi:hypothetical protein
VLLLGWPESRGDFMDAAFETSRSLFLTLRGEEKLNGRSLVDRIRGREAI